MGKKPKIIRDKLKVKIINVIWTPFETKKGERKKKKHNGRINVDRIIRDTRTHFERKQKKKKKKDRKRKYN